MLNNLGNSLQIRFVRTGSSADLDEAIQVAREAVTTTLKEHTDRTRWLSNLANALQARFARKGDLTDLDEAIRADREALAASPDSDPNRAGFLSNLGLCLQSRFERTHGLADLDEAIQVGWEAVVATPGSHPNRAMMLVALGTALRIRFEHTGDLTDLDEAIRADREAVAVSPDSHPDRALMLYMLGNALRLRLQLTGAQTDLDQAIDAFGHGMEVEAAPPWVRIGAARAGSELAVASRPEWAANLMERAVRLLPEVAPRRLERSDQQYALGGLSGLAGDAAALVLAVRSGSSAERAALALQLLEAGRAVLFSQALAVRSDLTDLTGQYPDLASRFIHLRDLLDPAPDLTIPSPFPAVNDQGVAAVSAADRLRHDRQQLAGELADVLAEIRTKKGFGSFAQLPSTAELLQQAAAGPVVAFNVSRYRSDALLLTEDGITSLPLPGLDMDTVIAQINTFHQALHLAVHGITSPERAAAQRD